MPTTVKVELTEVPIPPKPNVVITISDKEAKFLLGMIANLSKWQATQILTSGADDLRESYNIPDNLPTDFLYALYNALKGILDHE